MTAFMTGVAPRPSRLNLGSCGGSWSLPDASRLDLLLYARSALVTSGERRDGCCVGAADGRKKRCSVGVVRLSSIDISSEQLNGKSSYCRKQNEWIVSAASKRAVPLMKAMLIEEQVGLDRRGLGDANASETRYRSAPSVQFGNNLQR